MLDGVGELLLVVGCVVGWWCGRLEGGDVFSEGMA